MPVLARPFVDHLPHDDQREVLTALGAGLHEARLASQCVSAPGPQAETLPQLLAHLNRGIAHLQRAQDLLQAHV